MKVHFSICLIIALFYLNGCTPSSQNISYNSSNENAINNESNTEDQPVETQKSETADNLLEEKDVSELEPSYKIYSEEVYDELIGTKPFALFFHAGWCSVCRKMEADIKAELDTFPDGTIFLQADYDDESELKKKFGVTVQSTIVFFDASGASKGKLIGPNNDAIKAEISKIL